MAKKLTLVVSDQVYKAMREIAAAYEDTLSGVASTGIKALDWMLQQQRAGYTIKAEKEEDGKRIIKELAIT